MTEPKKPDSSVELPSLNLPGDETRIDFDSVPFDAIGLRDERGPERDTRGVPFPPATDSETPPDEVGPYRVSELPSTPASATSATASAEPAPPVPESTFEPASTARGSVPADFPAEPPAVNDVWTRWTEWKEPLLWTVAAIGLVLLIHFGGAFVTSLILLAGLSYGAYQFVITLEVPVRVTPEQAAKEFFAAIGHRLPNYARAYSLLTSDGRHADEFSGLADFRAYWNAQLARLNKFPVWLTPLELQLGGFACRYNPEKTMALVSYSLKVSMRGRASPLAEFDARNLVVKGPDGQWYMNDGRLPSTPKTPSNPT